jgi:hypothetical protein
MLMEQVANSLEEQELPERWSAKRKIEIVLRLLRGQDLSRSVTRAAALAGDPKLPGLCGRAGMQRDLRAVSANAERRVPVRAPLPNAGGGAGGDCRLRRALQPPVAGRAARLPDPRRGPPPVQLPGRVTKPGTCPGNRGLYTPAQRCLTRQSNLGRRRTRQVNTVCHLDPRAW